jgi:peptidoglycan/xylan/chitin deacetylase (PgdA/CDA1 family)
VEIMHGGSLSITVDIEDWYHIPSVCGSPFSVYRDIDEFFEKWPDRYDYLTGPTERALQLLNEYDITATFFVVGDIAQHYPGLIERIVDQGHEIACHGLHHKCKIDPRTKAAMVDRRAFEAMTIRSKRILESIYKKRVVGYRAPNAFIAGWMIDSLEGMGFKYDSSVSVNSLYNKSDDALAGVTTRPYYPEMSGLGSGGRRGFVEFPWPYLDMGVKVPTAGGPMLRFLNTGTILRGLGQSLKRGHTVLYFHPIDISEEKFPAVGKGRPMYWTIKGSLVEKKLRYLLSRLKPVKKVTLSEAMGSLNEGQAVRAKRYRQLATICE